MASLGVDKSPGQDGCTFRSEISMIRIKKPKVLCDKDNSTMKRESSSHKNQTRPTEKERKLLPRGKQAREHREAPMTKKSRRRRSDSSTLPSLEEQH